ncbi:ACT domain-containing protein [Leptobacterium flavescens]|uniref:ACT domain-containing protein n=1 Tax=Leptobacterium flavescens TaxID=472055 RepID=A0A6P0UFF6_9FLAO|nr:ACT domain-containing protein [Leptobacterium flavescens]NER12011.1 ACT domain-containing protein [Leptobacterium flavescens]
MAGETNLSELIRNMKPLLQDGEYIFSTLSQRDHIPEEHILAMFKEKEGITIVLERSQADLFKIKYESVFSWITLEVHSSLDAVGLTAAFSSALAKKGISCNVMAAYYHDHIFVNTKDKDKAIEVLISLSEEYKNRMEKQG